MQLDLERGVSVLGLVELLPGRPSEAWEFHIFYVRYPSPDQAGQANTCNVSQRDAPDLCQSQATKGYRSSRIGFPSVVP